MNVKEFQKLLDEQGEYSTPVPFKRGFMDSLLCRADFWFYKKLMKVVFDCHFCCKRGEWSSDIWPYHSYNVLRGLEECGGEFRIEGYNSRSKDEAPFVYISNHMSLVETFVLPVLTLKYSDIAIVLKEDLLKYPVFKSVLNAIRPIAVTRKNPREDLKCVMSKGQEALSQGRSVLVFPQATRSTEFSPEDFNTLGIKLAQKAGVPAVPIALKTDFLRPGKLIRDFGPLDRSRKIHFRFGTPIPVTRQNSKDAHREVISFISEAMDEWKRDGK